MNNELATLSAGTLMQQAIDRYNMTIEFVQMIMKDGKDFGTIPGSAKPTLLKPGAEKLSSLFQLYPVFRQADKILDWDGNLFFYQYECSLVNRASGEIWGSGLGSCSSRESKYLYRKGERVCPKCGKAAIIKGKTEYGGGWVCFSKKGGCGTKFNDGDPAIESQATGRVVNPDIPDLVNTIDKMAQKRALVAATLIACNASEFFTQDIEDMSFVGGYIEGEFTAVKPPPAAEPVKAETRKAEQDITKALAHLMNICNQDGIPYLLIDTDTLTHMSRSIGTKIAKNDLTPEAKEEAERKQDAIKEILTWRAANPTA